MRDISLKREKGVFKGVFRRIRINNEPDEEKGEENGEKRNKAGSVIAFKRKTGFPATLSRVPAR
jgi:hypothetical protein